MGFECVFDAAWQQFDEGEKPLDARNLRMGFIFAPLWKGLLRNTKESAQLGREALRRADDVFEAQYANPVAANALAIVTSGLLNFWLGDLVVFR